jgi:hypothetical protein
MSIDAYAIILLNVWLPDFSCLNETPCDPSSWELNKLTDIRIEDSIATHWACVLTHYENVMI